MTNSEILIEEATVEVNLASGCGCVHFDVAQRAVTPGQSLAVYDNDRCLGGGIIY